MKIKKGEILTIHQVAIYLKISEKTVYRLLLRKRFPGFKVGGSWRFTKEKINEWINNQKSFNNAKKGNQ